MSLHDETEAETRADRIDPVLRAAGWGTVDGSRIRREMICPRAHSGRREARQGARLRLRPFPQGAEARGA